MIFRWGTGLDQQVQRPFVYDLPFQFMRDEVAEARRRQWLMDTHIAAMVNRLLALCLVTGV